MGILADVCTHTALQSFPKMCVNMNTGQRQDMLKSDVMRKGELRQTAEKILHQTQKLTICNVRNIGEKCQY